MSYIYNTEREVTRKEYVASLESRTPEQLAEEEALYVELKRIEQSERRFKKERDELLRSLFGVESGLPDVNSDEDGLNATSSGGGMAISVSGSGLSVDTKKMKKRNAGEPETPMSATSASTSGIQLGQPQKKQQSAKSAAYGASILLVHLSRCFHIPNIFWCV